MKQIPLVITALLFLGTSVFAQRTDYSFDNFDVRNGVKTVAPVVVPPVKSVSRRSNSAEKKTRTALRNNAAPVDAASLVVPTVMTSGLTVSGANALRGYTTGSAEVDGYLIQSGKSNGVDPLLIYSVMNQESSFKSRAISPKGARGLMQLMPGTAMRYGVTNIFDPRQNIEGGARYLRFLLDHFDGDESGARW